MPARTPAEREVELSRRDDGVVLCFDSTYVWPACVTLRSVVRTWTGDVPLLAHCLCDESVGERQIAALEAVAASGSAGLRVIRRPFSLPDMRIPYISGMGYGRILAPRLIHATRLVYLDCDMLAVTSVHPLFRPLAEPCAVAAARDPYIPELGTPHVEAARIPMQDRGADFPYFNSGLLAVDVARWRRQGITERAVDLMRSVDWDPLFGDQDTLNHVIGGNFELLDQRWNVMPVSVVGALLDFIYHGERYTPMEYQRRLETAPWILHYATEVKPWTPRFTPGPLRDRWRAVATEAAEAMSAAGVPATQLLPPTEEPWWTPDHAAATHPAPASEPAESAAM